MTDRMTVAEFAGKFLNGDFDLPVTRVQIDAGWYDWFCRDTSLPNKTKVLGKKVLQLMKSEKVDANNMFVFFKNNCPMNGPLYDDFRFCNMETGDVVYTVSPKSGHTGMAEVWGEENDFQEPLAEGAWKDVKSFFGV